MKKTDDIAQSNSQESEKLYSPRFLAFCKLYDFHDEYLCVAYEAWEAQEDRIKAIESHWQKRVEALEKLKPYVVHDAPCVYPANNECTCGLMDVVESLNKLETP